MLPKKLRLKTDDFLALKSKNKKISLVSPNFFIKIFSNKLDHNRFGVVISKNIDKRSTKRNLLKRKIYKNLEDVSGDGKDILIIARPGSKDEDIEKEMKGLFKKIENFKN